ncbi:LAGLIDADG family homing endonuclease [Cytobacillus horneckiae]|uniref:LAGLIDADG family homing endonuclease n=1 Tax=Cytobacillus horneckiae TaxID=549687 RepID=UPI0034CDAE27
MEYKDKEWLINALAVYGNTNNLCNETGYAKTTVRKYVKKYGLECLSNPKRHIKKAEGVLYNNKSWLLEQLRLYGSGKKISEVHNLPKTSINRWIRKYGLQDKRNVGQNCRKHSLKEDFFENIDSEEKAYWLGFLIADGCIYHNKTSYDITFTLGLIDKPHLEKLKNSWGSSNLIKEIRGTKGNVDVRYCVSSKKMYKDLEGLGVIRRKTGFEIIPNIPRDLIRHFIRGYFDGDGSTTCFKEYSLIGFSICCSNRFFLENIKSHLEEELCIKLNPVGNANHGIFRLDTKNRDLCHRIYTYIYTDCHFSLDRKNETITNFLNIYSPLGE